ncbi:uncharacterized protein LOC115446750 isoform X1 [Manduca sexta]|uniref:uncharacterized protein LOC115446750 isoform X1 n=1 Tax=Manduca sexta TaxID=7130 RepID=UPI0011836C52|nr:uncharacterized protein LOC115446750 isoform X1 [Manduca sexta]
MGDEALWQSEQARCGVVLREVFLWLPGASLARAGATCRAWRRAAAEPALWRRLVLRTASPRAHDTLLATTENYEWREEFVCAHAQWKLTRTIPATAGGATLIHGALAPRDPWLALAADDASVTVWARGVGSTWRERWRHELREARGWASAARVLWAESGRRLLVAGPRALADVSSSWELLVLQFDDECHGREISRTRCSAGAAGCWAGPGGECYLALQTSVLAPGVACTAVWLNTATQETQSEYAGVTARLLRVYNEDGANILLARVLELPWSVLDAPPAGDDAAYYRATRVRTDNDDAPPTKNKQEGEWSHLRVLVLGWDSGRVGSGGRVCAWSLGAPQPPPVQATAAGSLRARYLAHRERMRAPPPDPPPPAEADVRALCTAPEAECTLPAPPLGLVAHPGGRCVWVNTADGQVWCMSVPALVPLRSLPPPLPRPAGPAPALYYAEPSATHHHVAAPAGALSGSACVWATLGDACAVLDARPAAPAAAALLLPGWPLSALILAGDAFHVWRSRATPQSLPGWP